MSMIAFLPVTLAALLLAAHFVRWEQLLPAVVCLALPPLALFVRRRWALLANQLLMLGGIAVWIVTTTQLVQERVAAGRPWGRMTLILGAVVLFTAFSAFLLFRPSLRERFPPA